MSPITIRYAMRQRRRSLAAAAVAGLFGFDSDGDDIVVADDVKLDVKPSDLVLFVGPSGSGKSSLLREAARQLDAVDVNALDLPDESLIDVLTGSVSDRLALLSSCGLAEARLALRTPTELSDGQRARFRFALALDRNATQPLAMDEFAALLDRPLAKVLAFNLRRLISRRGVGALVATTHEDIIDDLNPDVVVRCRGEGLVDVLRRNIAKKAVACCRHFGCRQAPGPIGRTSLGGITAATASDSSNASSCFGTTMNRSVSASSRRPSPG